MSALPPRRRLDPEAAALVRELLALNRLRILRKPMDEAQWARWEALRGEIEARLSGLSDGKIAPTRRQALRVPADVEVDYRSEPQPESERGRASMIAENGLFLATDSPPPPGTPLHLKLRDGGEVIELEGTVAWARSEASPLGPAGVGVEFAKLDDAQYEAVALLVAEALAAL